MSIGIILNKNAGKNRVFRGKMGEKLAFVLGDPESLRQTGSVDEIKKDLVCANQYAGTVAGDYGGDADQPWTLVGHSLGALGLDDDIGMRVIAVRRRGKWTYKPPDSTILRRGDTVIVRRGLDYGRQGFDRWSLTREVLKAIPESGEGD